MAYSNLLSKLDRAIVAYLVSKGAGSFEDTFPAKRSQGKTLPNTVVWSQKGEPDPPSSGVNRVDVAVMCKSNGLDAEGAAAGAARLAADARTAAVFDALLTNLDSSGDKLADDITAAARALAISDPTNHADLADFTVQNVFIGGPEAGFEENSDVWNDTLNLSVICCAKNVSDA